MAVYYIDPYTTSNGTGTWAFPFSFDASTRTGLTSGDELRIVARLLSNLLTVTTYTATRSAANQITIASGGGLGADFAVGNLVYFPDYDSFARVSAVATNLLTFGATLIPIPTTDTATINVRRVDFTVATPSATGLQFTLLNTTFSGITVTDGWVADGVRVTDGTAKSIIRSSSGTSSTCSLFFDRGTASTASYTVSAPNTYYVGNNAITATSVLATNILSLNIAQLYSGQANGANIADTTTLVRRPSTTYTVKHWTMNNFGTSSINPTITVTNLYVSNVMLGSYYGTNATVNIATMVINTLASGDIFFGGTTIASSAIYNLTTAVDIYQSAAPTLIATASGPYTVNILCPVYFNRRASTLTSVTRRYVLNQAMVAATQRDFYTPTINLGGSITASDNDNIASWNIFPLPANAWYQPYFKPAECRIYAGNDTAGFEPRVPNASVNILVTHASGAAPYEMLGVPSSPNGVNGTNAATSMPKAALDASVFRTAGPSIKVFLPTYSSAQWTNAGVGGVFATKNIRIPVVSGTTYTISGYIRTDQTGFLAGQCLVALTNGFTVSNSQSMTTACINAWEQFSFSYTATSTQEIYLAVSMQFSAGAKSFWIDDITIA